MEWKLWLFFSDMCFSGTPAFEAYILNCSNLLNVWNAQWVTLPDQSEASANAKNKLILWFHSCVTVINKGKVCPLHSTTASGTAFPCRLHYPPLCCWGEAEHLFLLHFTWQSFTSSLLLNIHCFCVPLNISKVKMLRNGGWTVLLQLKVSSALSLARFFYSWADRTRCADIENRVQGRYIYLIFSLREGRGWNKLRFWLEGEIK